MSCCLCEAGWDSWRWEHLAHFSYYIERRSSQLIPLMNLPHFLPPSPSSSARCVAPSRCGYLLLCSSADQRAGAGCPDTCCCASLNEPEKWGEGEHWDSHGKPIYFFLFQKEYWLRTLDAWGVCGVLSDIEVARKEMRWTASVSSYFLSLGAKKRQTFTHI